MTSKAEIVDIGELIAEFFPLGSGDLSLQVVVGEGAGRWILATEPTAAAIVRTITWETDPTTGTRSVRDVREQELNMGWPVLYEDRERIAAFFSALGAVLDELAAGDPSKLEDAMPCDLMCVDALGLRRARTQADFEAALRTKGRLGRFFPT